MQNDTPSDTRTKPSVPGDAQTAAPQVAQQEVDPATAEEIDRFIDKHRRLLEKLA